jgi:hypothetical protein
MRTTHVFPLVVLTCLLTARQAGGQRTTRGIYVDVGSLTSIRDLNTSGSEFLSGGLTIGGGLYWEPFPTDSSLRFQGDFLWNRQTLHTPKAGDGTNVDLSMVALNLDYIYWAHRRWALTLAGGGGAAFLHVWDTTGVVRARPFGRLGLGARYTASRRVQYVLQTYGIIYDIRNFPANSVLGPYSRRQSDVGFNLGVALKL